MTAAKTEAPEHKNLAAALVAIQQERPEILKNRDGHNYKYADLDQTLDAIMPVISKHGVSFIAKPKVDEHGKPVLYYKATHAASGEFEDGEMPLLLGKADMQAYGSSLTYARRYAVQAVFNLAAEDDDGRKAIEPPKTPQAPAKPPDAEPMNATGLKQLAITFDNYVSAGLPEDRLQMKLTAVGANFDGDYDQAFGNLSKQQGRVIWAFMTDALAAADEAARA